MTTLDIEKLLPWSEGTNIATSNGPKKLRKAVLAKGSPFWAEWKGNKEEMKELGVSCRKDSKGNWEAWWYMDLDPKRAAAAQAAREAATRQRQAARAAFVATLRPELQSRLKGLTDKLLPYQVDPVKCLTVALDTFGGAVDASDTGTGKTYAAVAAAIILRRPLFVVCPKAVIPSWKKVARHFGVEIQACNYELLRGGNQPALALRNPGKDEKFEWLLPKDTIITFDECHRLKDYRTYNCKMGLAAISQGYHVLGLSATAADNPLQMKFIGNLCRLFQEKEFWKWTQDNGCAKSRWGFEFLGGNKVLQRLHEEIFPLHGSRIRIAELGDAFPESLITAEVYDLNGNMEILNSVYAEMDEEIARIEAKEEADSFKQACILTAQLRARQRAEILKVPATANMAKDLEEEGMSVAIFVNYNETMDALMGKLGTDCVIRGGQTAAEREANIQRFQAMRRPRAAIHFPTPSAQDAKQALGRVARAPEKNAAPVDPALKPSPFIICNIKAGSVGIGLHDLDGSKSIQRIFFAAGTIEELVCRQVQDKVNRIDQLNDGDLSLTGEVRQQHFAPAKK